MNDKDNPNEAPPEAKEEKPKAPDGDGKEAKDKEKPSPFGPDIVPVMYILYNKKLDDYGVVGVPGYLDDKWRAYVTLKAAEKCLDDFYRKKKDAKSKFLMGVSAFSDKMNMKRFLGRKKL